MTTVRYGARSQQVNREIEAKKNADIWSEAVTAVYETEPDIVAAVLPPPLEPGPEPLVRVTITRVEMPGLPVFGAARMGSVVCEIVGRISGTRENYELAKTDFWFKLSPSPEAPGVLDQDPLLVYGEKTERTRVHESIEGELLLKEAPLDPVSDLVIRRMVDLNWTERASTQVGRIIGPVPRAALEPYIHQRYDDLSVLGAKR